MRISDWSSDVCSSDLLSANAAAVNKAVAELQETYPDAAITAQPDAMVSVIGSDISRSGLVHDALRALGAAGIAMIAMPTQIRNVDVQFLVAPRAFDAAARALHHESGRAHVGPPDTKADLVF